MTHGDAQSHGGSSGDCRIYLKSIRKQQKCLHQRRSALLCLHQRIQNRDENPVKSQKYIQNNAEINHRRRKDCW